MDNIKIAICEDSEEIRLQIREYLQLYQQGADFDFEVVEFSSGEALLEGWNQPNILLLDIELPGIDGIAAAKELSQINSIKDCHIIMVSGVPERFQETYRIMARDFVIKPVDKDKLFDALDYALKCINMMNKVVIYRKKIPHQIYEKEIYYVKAMGNYCKVASASYDGDLNESLTTLENTLSEKLFIRCHRSYLVNILYIEDVSTKGIKLVNKTVIPISRGRLDEIKSIISQIGLK